MPAPDPARSPGRAPASGTAVGRLLLALFRRMAGLRYRVRVTGLREVVARGRTGVVFLPNHPAMIDPVLVLSLLYRDFAPRSLADAHQIDRRFVRTLARWFGVRALPNLEREGLSAVERMRSALAQTIEGLRAAENLLFYPSGRLQRGRREELGGNSGVEVILQGAPNVRVVLVRQTGLWGSSFSFGHRGVMPDLWRTTGRAVARLLLNGVFFMPRRLVRIEFVEPDDFPRDADRMTINRWLEAFYNAEGTPNTYVPYGFWEAGGPRERPEPAGLEAEAETAMVPAATRKLVNEKLRAMGAPAGVQSADRLGDDLGLDSLAIAEIAVWLQKEFGAPVDTPDSLKTVGDVLLAAAGRGSSTLEGDLKPVGARWFAVGDPRRRLAIPGGDTITEVFLRQAAAGPGRVILADQVSGARTYRELLVSIRLLRPLIAELPEAHIGMMFPASVGAAVFYLAALFAGKTPVMINWTTGSRNIRHSLDLLGVRKVVTSRALIDRLNSLGVDLGEIGDRFVYAEDLRAKLTLARKILALVRTRLGVGDLRRARPTEVAVVLFTSGSESLPKAVPLTHRNILTNIRDVTCFGDVFAGDALIGMLPPFHSFGLVALTVLPLCLGMRIVYHPNPNDSALLARLIEAYKLTLLVGTPTFLGGILSVARPHQLVTLRAAVTGAEKCPESVYRALEKRCPALSILEGYGITECGPVVSINRLDAPVRYSIGLLLPHMEGAIVDLETNKRVPPGAAGMLLVRGPSVFDGYLNYEGERPFARFEGQEWYRTGDLVREAPGGVLFFEGRLKRFVKLGGEMISLPAIESVLAPHFVASDDQGPVIAIEALGHADNPEIVLFTARPAERTQVNEWLRAAGLSPLHNVRQVIRVEAIPVLGTGKTDYRALKDGFAAPAGR